MSIGARKGAKAARNRWLPEGRRGPMPWIIAIILFLTILAGAAGLGLAQALVQMRDELASGYTIQIVEANAKVRAAQVERVSAYLRQEKVVRSFSVVPEAKLLEQLEPWIGADVRADELPIPALIDVETAPNTGRKQIEAMAREIGAIAPAARIEARSAYLAPVERLMRGLMWLAAALVALMLVVTAAVAMLAARSAHEAHRSTIDIMHLLGATDLQIARLFQRRMTLDALFGAVVACLAAGAVLWLFGRGLFATGSELAGMLVLAWRPALILLAIPLFGILVATATARITVKRALERSL